MKNVAINNIIYTYCIYCLIVSTVLFSINSSLAQCANEGNYWNESWTSCEKSISPNLARGERHWLLYEFEEPQNISDCHIWNANLPGTSINGAKLVIIDYSIDGNTWFELGNYTFPKANESENYTGFDGPDFGSIFIKKILITILSTYGDNTCASIAEIQFNIDQNACYGTLDECGVCNGAGKTRWYYDADADGFGTPNQSLLSCDQPLNYVANKEDYCDNGFLGWNEVYTIFSDNGCLGCHGDSGLGGLQLSSYENFLKGGNKCGSNITTGNTLASIINIDNYNDCGTAISFPSMNERVGGEVDANEISLLQQWINIGTPEDCNCIEGATDSDFDGTCDYIDECINFDNRLIGLPCDDFDVCTENDIWISACDCVGTLKTDTDQDGVCDSLDISPLNACTADGITDGIEPGNWKAQLTNDCDQDNVYASNDINDYDACINNSGSTNTIACNCSQEYLSAGGKLIRSNDLPNDFRAEGMPDGNFSNGIYSHKSITLSYPWMPAGEEICFTIGFNNAAGAVTFSINYYPFTYFNENSELINFEPQQICIKTIQEGTQEIIITESGSGSIKVDGSVHKYCPCSFGDTFLNTPACNCSGNTITTAGSYASNTGISNADRAGGFPDGNLTANISGIDDELVLSLPAPNTFAEICMVFQFTDAMGLAKININNEIYYQPNYINDTLETLQMFCFPSSGFGAQTLKIYDSGLGVVRFDGAYIRYCNTQALTSCKNISNVTFNNLTTNGAFASWNQTFGFKEYTVRYKKTTESIWKVANSSNNYIQIKDLAACTSYNFQVRTKCNNNLFSSYKTFNFSTVGCPGLCENIITEFSFSNLSEDEQQVSNFIMSNGKVNNGTNFKYKAGNFIELRNGFEVKSQANFEALIQVCEE